MLLLIGMDLCAQDSIPSMDEVSVKGFETNRKLINVPASVSVLGNRDLQRFGNISLVPVINQVAGVRMEERSPGSYRLSIRGSLLRSPFGVRNVKIYWKDMMLTDAGGNTYLNIVDFNAVGGVEIIKGPAGSIYGAGTGGVMVLKEPSMPEKGQDVMVQLNGGSFGTFGGALRWQGGTEKFSWLVMQSHLQQDGYRENSRLRRDLTQGKLSWKTGSRNTVEALLLYGDLAYRTPGGLTLAQMNANPRQARPATPALPSAVQQQAGVYNRTLLAGLTNTYRFNAQWENVTTVTANFTNFRNPFITNYETRDEDGWGLRSKFNFSGGIAGHAFRWTTGVELQQGFSTIDSTGNTGGVASGRKVQDRLKATQQFLFTQAEIELGKLLVQVAFSFNNFSYNLQRRIPIAPAAELRYDNQLLPRMALLYKLTDRISMHASLSKGYSAPSLAEIRPSAGGLSTDLQAEYGWNYEAGFRGSALRSRIQFDMTVFHFSLKDAIVRRTNAAGAEFFVNAGGTRQQGLEAFVEAYPVNRAEGWLRQWRVWTSFTWFDFVFRDYRVNNTDYSGNDLTGVPSKLLLAGTDLSFAAGIYTNVTFNYTSSLPLTDANDAFADDYRLWQIRAGWKKKWGRGITTDIFTGIDNAGNELYSLGNDINAFGRRYYNPAPTRNFYAGIRMLF